LVLLRSVINFRVFNQFAAYRDKASGCLCAFFVRRFSVWLAPCGTVWHRYWLSCGTDVAPWLVAFRVAPCGTVWRTVWHRYSADTTAINRMAYHARDLPCHA
jgi:hypothetical protein